MNIKMLDPYSSSIAPARYSNKFLQNSHYFLTSIFSPEFFLDGFGVSPKEPSKQLFRRFSEVWWVTETDFVALSTVWPCDILSYDFPACDNNMRHSGRLAPLCQHL